MATDQNNQNKSTRAIAVISLAIGLFFGVAITWFYLSGPDDTCASVENFRAEKSADQNEVNLTWSRLDAADTSFFIVLQDLDFPEEENATRSFFGKDGLKLDSGSLKSRRNYRVQLFRVCDPSATNLKLSNPVTQEFNTLDWVIIEDVVHVKLPENETDLRMQNATCEALGTAGTPVSLDAQNRFNWTPAVKEYYKIFITQDGSNGSAITALLEKDFDGKYLVKSHINVNCGSFSTSSAEAPIDSCPGSPRGTFCNPNGSPVPYTILVTTSNCSINVGVPGYTVRVERCE